MHHFFRVKGHVASADHLAAMSDFESSFTTIIGVNRVGSLIGLSLYSIFVKISFDWMRSWWRGRAFAKKAYDAAAYNAFRPTYPKQLYDTLWMYHRQGRGKDAKGWHRAVDLGCGTGQATVDIAGQFDEVIGVDPSSKMIEQARGQLGGLSIPKKPLSRQEDLESSSTSHREAEDVIQYKQGAAEGLSFLDNDSVDFISAGQAIHWFDYSRLWKEVARVLRPGGTAAFWGYSELRIKDQPNLTPLITYYSRGSQPIGPETTGKAKEESESLSAYWEQPGRAIVDAGLITVPSPSKDTFDPSEAKVVLFNGKHREDIIKQDWQRPVEVADVILRKEMTWELLDNYCRTWSNLHNFLAKFPQEKEKRVSDGHPANEKGDIVQRFLARLKHESEKSHGKALEKLEIEWPMTLLLYRKRSTS